MKKIVKTMFFKVTVGVLLMFVLWATVLRMPLSTGEVVKDIDNNRDVIGKYVRFEVTDVVQDTAIGDAVHTDNRHLVIQPDDDKYWELGKTYSYKIIDVQEVLGVYIILLDTEEDGNESN